MIIIFSSTDYDQHGCNNDIRNSNDFWILSIHYESRECHCTNGMRPFCMAHSVHEYHINSHSLQQFINGWSTISFLKRVPLGKCQVNYHAVSYSIAGEKDSTNCARYNQLLPWYGHYPIGEENRCDYKKVASILLVIHYAFFSISSSISWANYLSKRTNAIQLSVAVYSRLIGLYFLMYVGDVWVELALFSRGWNIS